VRGDSCATICWACSGAAIFQISDNAGSPESVAAGGVGETRALGPPPDHSEYVVRVHPMARELFPIAEAAEQLGFPDSGSFDPGVEILAQTMMARELMTLASFL
jgi:hypothetical protein